MEQIEERNFPLVRNKSSEGKGSGGAVTEKEVPSLSNFQIQLELRMRVSTSHERTVYA